jgi:hypothetical protein
MYPFMLAHPWLSFFAAIAAIDAVRAILSPSCPKCPSCTGATLTSGMHVPLFGDVSQIAVPHGNGVYHGLVRG